MSDTSTPIPIPSDLDHDFAERITKAIEDCNRSSARAAAAIKASEEACAQARRLLQQIEQQGGHKDESPRVFVRAGRVDNADTSNH